MKKEGLCVCVCECVCVCLEVMEKMRDDFGDALALALW